MKLQVAPLGAETCSQETSQNSSIMIGKNRLISSYGNKGFKSTGADGRSFNTGILTTNGISSFIQSSTAL
jgi:hypothetical protein